MLKLLVPTAALALGLLAGCHTSSPATSAAPPLDDAPGMPPPAAAPAPGAPTEAAARAAVGRHIQALPNAALFVPDSARVTDNDATWQVLVPRTDWAGRMPNRARFEVDKQTGEVRSAPVK